MRSCEICHKGSQIQKSGAHQYGGGWAMRAPKKRRVWLPNLHAAKVTYQGVRRTMRLCSRCLRRVKALSPTRHSGVKQSGAIESISLENPTPKVNESSVATA